MYGLGRIYIEDERDNDYPFSEVISQHPYSTSTKKFWWSNGWWGNQGDSPHCVAFSLTHWLSDGPLLNSVIATKNPAVNTNLLYCEAQKVDPWPGDCNNKLYDGTTVRAGAQVLKNWGHIEEYRWARTIDEVVSAVLIQGPVVVGTLWTTDMFSPNHEGIIKPGGRSAGGHAYLINGVNTQTGLFRIKNSWGKYWGVGGHAYVSIEDMSGLISNYGEACVPMQKRLI